MISKNHHKQHDESPTSSSSQHGKLFVDYPYPVITELNEICKKQKKSSDHSYSLKSLQWYKDNFEKMFSLIHNIPIQRTPSSIFEQSFRQAHINERSSKVIVNNLQNQTKPTRITRILASSMNSSFHEEEKQNNNKIHTRRILHTKFTQTINDDKG